MKKRNKTFTNQSANRIQLNTPALRRPFPPVRIHALKYSLSAAAILLQSPTLVMAADAVDGAQGHQLPDLVVVGGGIARGFQETLHDQPTTIHSIGADEIERMDSRTTLDIIRRIPGVSAEDYNQRGVAAAYSFRGFRGGHGIGAGSYLDGIPYNEINHLEGDGYPDYNTVLPETIERVEVLKGLFSPQFGGYSQAGVLHFITKERGDYSKLKLQAGSWGYRRGVLEVAKEHGKFFTYNAIGTDQGDGFRDHSEFHGGNIFSRLGYDINPDSTVRVTIHSYKTQWNAPGPIPQEDWDNDNLKRQVAEGGGYKKKNMLSTDYTLRLSDSSEVSALAYGYEAEYTRLAGSNNQENFDDRMTYGFRTAYARSDQFSLFDNDFRIGLDFENADSKGRRWNPVHPMTSERGPILISRDFDFDNTSVYFQNDIRPSSWLKVTLGGRYDTFDGTVFDNLTNTRDSYSEQIFNPKAGILITPTESLEFHANMGSGFVLPGGATKFTSDSLDNIEIKTYDVGARYQPIPEALLEVSLYRAKVTNEIITDAVTLVQSNLGDTTREGVEASAQWFINRDTLIYINAATADSEFGYRNTTGGDFTGNRVPRVPEVVGSLGFEYLPDLGFGGTLNLRYTGKRWNDNANTIREEDFSVLSGSIRYATPRVTYTLFLNNILDEKYSELRGATEFYPADPFNVTLTASMLLD